MIARELAISRHHDQEKKMRARIAMTEVSLERNNRILISDTCWFTQCTYDSNLGAVGHCIKILQKFDTHTIMQPHGPLYRQTKKSGG